jgi:hypothetical protein
MTHSLMLRLQQLAFYQRSWPPESANHAEKERHLSELTSAFLSRIVCSTSSCKQLTCSRGTKLC